MSEKGEFTQASGVRFVCVLPGPIENVWALLTDAKQLPQWFGEDGRIEARQGGAVWLMDGHIRGVVTQWRPPHKLIYSWNVFEPGAAADAVSAYPESYPTFELATRGDAVELTFTHFPVLERFAAQNAMGWHTMLDLIEARVRGEHLRERGFYMQKNAVLYGVDLQSLAR